MAHLLLALEYSGAGNGGWPLDGEAVKPLVRVATVVHTGYGLLARIATLLEAHGAVEDSGLAREVVRGDVGAEAGDAGFYAGRLVSVEVGRGRAGFDQVSAGGCESFCRPDEVVTGNGDLHANDEQGPAFERYLFGLVFRQPEVPEQLPGVWTVQAEYGVRI